MGGLQWFTCELFLYLVFHSARLIYQLQVTLSNLYVQLYFCYRLWVISQRVWWPFVPIITLLLASLGGALYGVSEYLLSLYARIHSLMTVTQVVRAQ